MPILIGELRTDDIELLAEMQLAFILFTQLQNFSALEVYKRHLSLFSRSMSTLLPESDNRPGLSANTALPLYLNLLEKVLIPQFGYLRAEFFAEDLPDAGFEEFLIAEIGTHLRKALRTSSRSHASSSDRASLAAKGYLEKISSAWTRLSALLEKKFGWEPLGSLDAASGKEGVRQDWEAVAREMKERGKTRVSYNLLKDPGDGHGSDDGPEYEDEDDEDAPVVVEL